MRRSRNIFGYTRYKYPDVPTHTAEMERKRELIKFILKDYCESLTPEPPKPKPIAWWNVHARAERRMKGVADRVSTVGRAVETNVRSVKERFFPPKPDLGIEFIVGRD